MDKIILSGMTFYGYHGLTQAEQERGQPFTVDVEVALDLAPAARSDDINQTLDYEGVFQKVKEITTKKTFNLLETLAENIAQAILENPQAREVKVRAKKPHPPLPGDLEYAGVEIVRRR